MLEVDLVSKHLPDGRLLMRDIRFTLRPAEVVVITGPSGCGKSTLLGIVAGLDADFEGHVAWHGAPRLGMVFQAPRLLPWRTALDNVALAAGGGAEGRARAARALERVGLADAADVFPSRLSVGMARRVALARALVIEPEALLLDESFVSLDPKTAAKMRTIVLDEVVRRGLAVLMVSHDLKEAEQMGQTILVLGGTPTHLLAVETGPQAERLSGDAPR
jgi:NitT/TauT family transport system ATP-binding protein